VSGLHFRASGDQPSFAPHLWHVDTISSHDPPWACTRIARRHSPSEWHKHRDVHGRDCGTKRFAVPRCPRQGCDCPVLKSLHEVSRRWRLRSPEFVYHARSRALQTSVLFSQSSHFREGRLRDQKVAIGFVQVGVLFARRQLLDAKIIKHSEIRPADDVGHEWLERDRRRRRSELLHCR
jgi:hypothetical protein